MKAEDLMIGDWVHYKMDLGKDGIYEKNIQIINIYGREVNCGLRGYEIISGKRMNNLEPIPLTPEILEKNGFEKLGYDGWEYKLEKGNKLIYSVLWRCNYPNALRISSYSLVYGDFNSSHIDNVHELQHALKLCGIEKEIEL